MSGFNPSNGCVGSLCPPFTSPSQIDSYKTALNSEKTNGKLKGVSFLQLKVAAVPGNNLKSINSGADNLPGVIVWSWPGTFTVVYVDGNGTSSFAYNNDATGQVQLTTGGVIYNPPTVITPPSSEGAVNWWAWIAGGVSCICMFFILLFVLMKSRKK
jgi:hypothetical protein